MTTALTKSVFAGLTPDKFCTGSLARDIDGRKVFPEDPTAVKWCAFGWILRYTLTEIELYAVIKDLDKLANILGYPQATFANDQMGYKFIETINNGDG